MSSMESSGRLIEILLVEVVTQIDEFWVTVVTLTRE